MLSGTRLHVFDALLNGLAVTVDAPAVWSWNRMSSYSYLPLILVGRTCWAHWGNPLVELPQEWQLLV